MNQHYQLFKTQSKILELLIHTTINWMIPTGNPLPNLITGSILNTDFLTEFTKQQLSILTVLVLSVSSARNRHMFVTPE
jgi:hypothetical protein